MTRVRVATSLDEAAVLDVLRADGHAAGRQPSKARLLRVRDKLRSPTALTLVAEADDGVQGFLHAELARDDDGAGPVTPGLLHLSLLCVSPDARRSGVGRALVTALLDRFPRVEGWASDDATRGLLLACGFRPTGRTAVRDAAAEQLLHA